MPEYYQPCFDLAELRNSTSALVIRAFTNVAADGDCEKSLVKSIGAEELTVIIMLLEVSANAGQNIGTLIDQPSDTNFITYKAARRLNLRSESITLVVHGLGGITMEVKTQRYLLKVRISTPEGRVRAHELICYGLEEITIVYKVVKAEQLTKFFLCVKA